MSPLLEDYLAKVDASLRVDPERKRLIVDELRAHLHDRIADESAQSGEPHDAIVRRVLADMGSPTDLALAYDEEGAVLRNVAGEVVIRLSRALGRGASYVATHAPPAARAVGRGASRLFKVLAVVAVVALVVVAGVAVWAYYEVRPHIPSIVESSTPAFSYAERCDGTPCHGTAPGGRFHVGPDAQHVRLDVDVWASRTTDAQGNVTILVSDPDGVERFNHTYSLDAQDRAHQEQRLAAAPGEWRVALVYDGFRGSVDVEVYAYTVAWLEA